MSAEHKHLEPGFYTVDLFDCPDFRMFHSNDCPRAVDILDHKSFEPMSMKLWCSLVRGAQTIIDVGAHVGVYSLAAAALRSDIPIYAFEPNPDVFARLALHVNLNEFKNIQPCRWGIGEVDAVILLRWVDKGLGNLSSGSHFGSDEPGYNVSPVFVRPLDMSHKKAPVAMKIDVEGAEKSVFKHLSLVHRPDIILETFSQKNAAYITQQTEKLGYRYFLIDEQNMRLIPEPKLIACDKTGTNYNQFLTTHPENTTDWI